VKPFRLLTLLLAFATLAAVAQAHPGHDGHELTWDLGHLAQHPLATVGWAAVLALAVGAGVWGARRYSLRGSQARRGK